MLGLVRTNNIMMVELVIVISDSLYPVSHQAPIELRLLYARVFWFRNEAEADLPTQ